MSNQYLLQELQRAKNLVVSLAREIDNKNESLLEIESKLEEASEALSKKETENRRLHQELIQEQKKRKFTSQSSEKLQQRFDSLKNELEMMIERLNKQKAQHDMERANLLLEKEKVKAQHDLERENLLLEKEKLKARTPFEWDFEMISQLEDLRRELDEKVDELQCMDNLNQTLILKEHMSNLELQHARKELINGLQDFWGYQTKIRIKRMGEVNPEPFKDACKKVSADWELKSSELCSLWQESVKNPEWYPFKTELVDGKHKEIINGDDDLLKELRSDWGDEVLKAVSDALLELNEYNGSGRYIVQELWNFQEGRKASLKEAVECIIQELKNQKLHKRRR